MIKILKLILFFVLFIALTLIKQIHFALNIIFILFILYLPQLMQFFDDLKWMNAALVDEEAHKRVKEERERYIFVMENIEARRIRKNMTIDELKKILEEFKKGTIQLGLYLGEGKARKVKKIYFFGYGLKIPTPQLILFLKDDKLIGWRKSLFF